MTIFSGQSLRKAVNDSTRTIWQPCNIYKTARLGNDVSIGMFTEIGNEVFIGDRTRVGAQCFIPEGVIIESDVFIGPKVCFTNDKYPPSGRESWGFTVVKQKASIGAGSVILTGVCIGEGSLVGAGSVVTKSVPAGEVWCGNPATKLKNIKDIDGLRATQKAEGIIAQV